jgi:hypothetical protein
MRGRITLMMLLASTLLFTSCRLSDEQQIGVLRFVASSITGAIDDARPAAKVQPVAAPRGLSPCSAIPAVSNVNSRRMVESRVRAVKVQTCRVRVRALPASILIHFDVDALRRFITANGVAVAGTCRTRPAPAVRS